MDKKCNKYEAYFTFATQEEYENHIANCQDCLNEKLKEEKLSNLIKDSAETYKELCKKQKAKKTMLKIACSMLLFVSLSTFAGFEMTQLNQPQKFTNTNAEISVISEYGLPVDEYGFFDYQ